MNTSVMSLHDKNVILVTGGNRGIGKAICKGLLTQHPADVHVILGSRNLENGRQAAADISLLKITDSPRITVIQLDVTSDSSVKAAAKLVSSMGCKLYGIVNNAAVSPCTSTSCKDLLDTNYFGARRVNKAFGPMLTKPGGRIVNVSSVGAPTYLSGCLFSFGVKGKRRDLHHKLANPSMIEGGIKELDAIASREALVLCKPTLGTFLGAPVLRPKDHAYQLSKAFLNAYTVLHSKLEPDLIINSCCTGFVDTHLVPKRLGFTGTTDEGAVMPMKLLMGDEFTSDRDGNFFIEGKPRKLEEIPDLQVYPKSFAVIFEKFRPLQEQRKQQQQQSWQQQQQQQIYLQKKRSDSCATAGYSIFLLLSLVTAICAAHSFFAALPR